jgi:hypothetical protein
MTSTMTSDVPEGVKTARRYIEQLEANQFGWDILVGDAFVRGMRDIGYKSTSFALAELIDNSLQADPSRIDILFGFDNGKKPTKIAIVDDGHGMDPKMVRASLVWGAGTRADNLVGFGKYGYGLPSASVSQCHRVTVYSKTADGQWHSAYLDIDEIKDGNANWIKENRIEMPSEVASEPPQFVLDHFKEHGGGNHGTVVVWENLDRVDPKTRDHLRAELLTQLGVIYRRFLVNTPMMVDGESVEPCDPLFLTEGFRYYDLDSDRAIEYPGAVVEVSDKETGKPVGKMRIRYSRLPATFFRKPEAKHTNKPGRGKTNERLEIADANTGIIFMRNGRQIDAIRPPRSFRSVNATTDRFWAVEVDFDASLDDLFSITTSKQQVSPDTRIWDILKDKGGMFAAIGTMFSDYLKDAKEIAVKSEADKEAQRASVAAIEGAKKFKTTPAPKDTPERRKEAQDNLKGEAKRRAGKAGIDTSVVERELVAQQEGIDHSVESEDLPGAPFFRCEQRGAMRVLNINRAHPFFEQLYMAPSSTPRSRAALEVLLWALGEAEVDADPNSERRQFYERERGSAWSPYLADALKMLSTMSIVEDEPEVLTTEDGETAA